MENTKKFVNKLIIAIILSSILFNTVKVNVILYYSTVTSLWILMFLNYGMGTNLEFFDSLIAISLGNFISYISHNGFGNKGADFLRFTLYLIFFLTISISSFLFYLFKEKSFQEKIKLMAKREKDLEMLSYYIDNFEIVGINGRWGAGKSFLVNEWRERNKDKYEIIEIDILSCNLNELQLILIKEIEKIMYKNKIISRYSNTLKSFLTDKTIFSKLKNLVFVEDNSYSETIRGFQNELKKVDKKIVIIYEDIDRIKDEDVIKNIFGISEKLSNERIKIIYQYHEENLKDIGFTSDYLEKYIPFKMNLTEINFFEILNFLFKENYADEDVLEIKDFDFLREHHQRYRYNILQEEFRIDKDISLMIANVSIRKVKNFLNELSNILVIKQYKQYKEVVISFFFIKHFIPPVYEKLNVEEGLLETIKFQVNSEAYTMGELISVYNLGELSQDEIGEIFDIKENQMNYCVLKLFNYRNNPVVDEDDYEKRLHSILEEPIKTLRDRNSNDKKDRLIWSLLAHGKSQYTDYEYVGNKFIKEVLDMPRNQQSNAYREFTKSLFHQDSQELDNETIFKMGIPSFIELFKSFRILDVTDEQQIGLVDIYFELENIQDITQEFIQTINYCSLKTQKEYIYILSRINKLNVVGNFNSQECFADFLKNYIGALSSLGYINTREYFSIRGPGDIGKYKSLIIKDLGKIIIKVNKLKEKIVSSLKFKELEIELDTIIEFMGKLIEIIGFQTEATKKEYGITTSNFSSHFINQEEFDRLKGIAAEGKSLQEEIRKSYLEGKITVYEIDKLLEELENTNLQESTN